MGQGWGAGRRNGRAVYLERRSQRPRGFLFLTVHSSFINRNKFRLIDSPSLVSARGFEETCAAPPARSRGLGSSIRFKETNSSKRRGRDPPPSLLLPPVALHELSAVQRRFRRFLGNGASVGGGEVLEGLFAWSCASEDPEERCYSVNNLIVPRRQSDLKCRLCV